MENTIKKHVHNRLISFIIISQVITSCTTSNPKILPTPIIDIHLLPEYSDTKIADLKTLPKITYTETKKEVGKEKTPDITTEIHDTKREKPTVPIQKVTNQQKKEFATITLNFTQIGISELTKIILNDFLKKPYAIDPDVTGKVTIQTATPLKKSQLLKILNDLVESTNNTLIQKNGIYRLQPKKEGYQYEHTEQGQKDYKTLIIPLRNITSTQAKNILEPYKEEIKISFDNINNTVMLSGNKQITNQLLNTINQLDIPEYHNKSFLIAIIKNTKPDHIVNELNTIFNYANTKKTTIEFISLARIKSILVITSDSNHLDSIKKWIISLDTNKYTKKSLFSYSTNHKKASELAELYNKIINNKKPENENNNNQIIDTTIKNQGAITKTDQKISKEQITGLTYDDSTNTVYLYSRDTDIEETKRILSILDKRQPQVFIETTIIEVSLTGALSNGIEWFFKTKLTANHSAQLGFDNDESTGITMPIPSFSFGIVSSINALKLLFSTIETNSYFNVISSPSIVVTNNKTATINIGDQVPILDSTSQNNTNANDRITNTIKYRDTGVIMEVTPSIKNGNQVQIDIKQELTDVANTTTSGIDAPTFKQRTIQTEVIVKNNQTIILGGMIRNNQDTNNKNIPRLKNIPVVKNLTNKNTNNQNRTELIVLLKPKILKDNESITNLTNEQKRRFRRIKDAFVSPE